VAKYQRFFARFWQSPKVRGWPDHQKLLGAYLLTCPHRTSEGLFWLPHGYVAQDLGWSIERVSEGYSGLKQAGFCAYDDTSETVLLCKALKYDAPAGPKQIQGAITRLADVPPTPLFAQLRDAAAAYAPDFCKALDTALERGILHYHRGPTDTPPKGYRNPTDSSSSTPYPSPSPVVEGVPPFTGVGDMPADNDQPSRRKGRKGKAPRQSRPPRTPRHPGDEFVIQRARQIRAESGPDAAQAYLRKVSDSYGQMTKQEQLRRLEEIIAQDAAAEEGGS
jgi:hypothetical protein